MLEDQQTINTDEEEQFLAGKLRKAREGGYSAVVQGLFILFTLIAGLSLGFYTGYRMSLRRIESYLRVIQEQESEAVFTPVDLNTLLSEPAAAYGTPGAKTQIRFFLDFQCPYCSDLITAVPGNLIDTMGETVYIEFYDFPLSEHQNAKLAASYARCFSESGGNYLEFVESIEQNRVSWTGNNSENAEDFFQSTIEQLGKDKATAAKCAGEGSVLAAIEANIQDGKKLGVMATPSYAINNLLTSGSMDAEAFKQLIKNAALIAVEQENNE